MIIWKIENLKNDFNDVLDDWTVINYKVHPFNVEHVRERATCHLKRLK